MLVWCKLFQCVLHLTLEYPVMLLSTMFYTVTPVCHTVYCKSNKQNSLMSPLFSFFLCSPLHFFSTRHLQMSFILTKLHRLSHSFPAHPFLLSFPLFSLHCNFLSFCLIPQLLSNVIFLLFHFNLYFPPSCHLCPHIFHYCFLLHRCFFSSIGYGR